MQQSGGVFLSVRASYDLETPCVFLDTANQNACRMQEAKPTECATSGCWKDGECDDIEPWTREEIMALGWDGHED